MEAEVCVVTLGEGSQELSLTFPVRSLGHVVSTWLTIRPRSAGHTWAGLGEDLQVVSGEYLGKGLCSGVRWPRREMGACGTRPRPLAPQGVRSHRRL